MQGKLVVPKSEVKKLQSAAYLKGTEILDGAITIGDETHLEVKFKDVQTLYNTVQMMAKVDGTEIETIKAAKQKAIDAKAASQAKAKK
jgi:hypothetical protein